MSFTFTEDQRLLAESADRFVENEYGFSARREAMARDGGFSRETWSTFAELGWLALPLPEECDGLGGSTVDVAVLLESLGRGLVVEPYQSSIVLGAGCVTTAGSAEQRSRILPAVAAGEHLLALAHVEPRSRYALAHVETAATRNGSGWRLDGAKAVVHNAETADTLLVSARSAGAATDRDGITLFLVARDAEGVSLRSYPTVDGLRASEVTLDGVTVGDEAVLGDVEDGLSAIEAVVDRACVLLCAEAAGAMDAAVRLTTAYLKERRQFGVPIGSFQSLQHRAVDMLGAQQFARALMYRAAGVIDGADPLERARAASAAKVEAGRAGRMVGQEAVQLHGGMGMTDEMAIGHYFKRLSTIDAQFGNTDHHVRRFAALA